MADMAPQEAGSVAGDRPRVGSLCTGYGGLDLAVERVLGGELVWLAEYDDAPAEVCATRFPDVPNLRDITVLDWQQVPPVDVLTAGYPCQPFSHAGRRGGTSDERHLWPHVADAVRVLRPRLVVLENVAGHLSLGFDAVLADLAALGFDAEWTVLRASDVGACHQRARLFIVATDPGGSGAWGNPGGLPGTPTQPRRAGEHLHAPLDAGQDVADADGGGLEGSSELDGDQASFTADGHPRWGHVDRRCDAAPDSNHLGCERGGSSWGRRSGPADDDAVTPDAHLAGLEGREPAQGRVVPSWRGSWGDYGPAIDRHARVLGRPAPAPVDDEDRLSPLFVEWVMMLPEGWVTDVLTTRTKALRCLGNGVVPSQASAAVAHLLARFESVENAS